MTNGQNGLRFDIYERLQLSEGVASIRELEGVELTPHIQVLPQGEQAVLRGNLLLTGTYVDDQDRGDQALEHLIPVEITLPLSRVQRVEDISVEIENFDVDLLSERSLNITGVLSLNGVEVASEPELNSWREPEEEMVFIHEAAAPQAVQPASIEPPAAEWASTEPAWFARESAQAEQATPFSAWTTTASVRNEIVDRDSEETATFAASGVPSEELEGWAQPAGTEALQEHESLTVSSASAADEKKEPKIAFGSKFGPSGAEVPASAPVSKPFGLASLLKQATSGTFEARNQDTAAVETAKPEAPPEKVEWKKLLLTSMNENQEFRRVRLCIVQKDDTLESIAKRYELNPREIALFNRLGDSEVTAGQIVYIPK